MFSAEFSQLNDTIDYMCVYVFDLCSQTLAAELVTLGGELTSQGSEVIGVLGSGGCHLCVDHLGKLLPVFQSSLAAREKQLQAQLEKTGHHQVRTTTALPVVYLRN